MSEPSHSIAATLATFAIDSSVESISGEVGGRAALHLLDAVGCGLAAVGSGAGEHASAVAASEGGGEGASLFGCAHRVSAANAALGNGTRCHALDFDDTHERGICHSSAVVAPAALAVGEARGASGSEVLAAFALGSEVALRIAVATADGLYARGLHPTSVCGVFGATAAAARLLGLDPAAATSALGIAGSFAGGLFEYLSDGSATKPIHAGWAAHAGVHAAQLAAAGASGPATVIEGRFGLAAAHAGGGELGPITAKLGSRWELTGLSIKPYPACHFVHAPTWAAGELVDEHGITPDRIAEIAVRIPEEGVALVLEPAATKARPQTSYDAKFSLPFTIAHRVLHGHLDLASFTEERIADPAILELARCVRGERLDNEAPSRFAGGSRIRTKDGEELDRFLPHTPGSPANPLDQPWLLSKFRANAQLSLGPDETGELLERLRSLEAEDSLARIGELVRGARAADAG